MNKKVTEWQILFSMTSDKDDFYTEDEDEYKEYFQELKDNNELNEIEQCIKKTYIWNDEVEDWEEDWVDVLYDGTTDTLYEALTENTEDTYNIYTLSEVGYNEYKSEFITSVDSEEQAIDRVAELKAETGGNVYYVKASEDDIQLRKKAKENAQKAPEIVELGYTDGGYQNNAITLYGKLADGTYFVYYTEMDLVETYDCEPDELFDILYATEDEMSEEDRTELYNDFFEQHNIDTYGPGDPIFDKLHILYYTDEYKHFYESKSLSEDTVEENLNEANNKINLEPLSDDLYKELVNIAELYYEDLDNEEDDTFAGTDDSYANEMLEQRLGDLITSSKAFYLWVSEHYDTTTLELKRKAYLDAYSKFMQIIKSNNLADYKQDKVKNESVNANNYGKDKSDFKQMLKTFDNNGKYAKRGNWEIGRGGYDLWYEVSYNKVPVIGCTAGKVSAYQKGFEEYAKLVAEEYGDTYIDTLTEGKVTTTSGTYDTDKYDEICNKVKQAYKDAWEGKISYSDLENIKKQSGLSSGELSSVQYMASRETDKKEETKKYDINDNTKFVSYEPDMEGTYTMSDMKKVYNTKVSDDYKKEGLDFKDWLNDMLKSGVYEIVEENKSLSTLKSKLTDKINKILQTPEYGFEPNEISKYTVIEIKPLNDTETKVEIRAELSYEALNGLIEELNPIVQQYDKEAYFDIEEPGIASAIINNTIKKVTESMSKDDIMQCYISDITRYAYTYKKKDAQKEIDFVLDDLRNDKDLDEKEKAFIMKMVRPALLDKNIDYEDIIVENKVITESANLTDLQVGMTMFRYYINGATIYLETDKKIRNKADANTIFEIYAKYNNIDLAKYTQEQIDKAKDMILAQMDLITVTNVDDSGFSYTGKYSGGSENVTEIDTINNRLYVIYDSYKITRENKSIKYEAVDKEEIKDKVEQEKQETGIKDDIDTEEEVKTATKKEVYQYAKQQGLDLEKLRKQGIELSEVAETLDKVIGNMVSKSIIEYEDKTGKSVVWDYKVTNNDIDIIISEI